MVHIAKYIRAQPNLSKSGHSNYRCFFLVLEWSKQDAHQAIQKPEHLITEHRSIFEYWTEWTHLVVVQTISFGHRPNH